MYSTSYYVFYVKLRSSRELEGKIVFVFPRIQNYLEAYDVAALVVGRLVAINKLWYIKKYQDQNTSFDKICSTTSQTKIHNFDFTLLFKI